MKYFIYGILLILLALLVAHLTDYNGRMRAYNAHVCAVNGYEPDCKTKL